MVELNFEKILIIVALIGLVIIIAKAIQNEKELKQLKYEKEKEKEQYYRYKGYKAETSDYYLMSDREKILYLYDGLDSKNQNKVLSYIYKTAKDQESERFK